MKLRSFNRFFVEAFQSLRRNLAMSIASIVTIALTLFVCGVFAVIVLNINHFAGEIESSVEVQVFMEDGLDETGRAALEEEIKDIDGVASLAFVSKDEALESMAARLGDTPQGLLDSLGGNPLPDSYLVQAKTADDVIPAAEKMEKLSGVDDVKYGEGTVEKLFSLLKWVRYFGIGLIAFLAVASIIIVAFNIKITVANRRSEITIMRYVGASNWYIRWPFCIAGMVMGLFGGLISVGLLYGAYSLVIDKVNELLVFANLMAPDMNFIYIFIAMIIVGVFLGSAGSMISLNVYLKEKSKAI
ncbi:MAG: permease-like cell division protein FtsX [Bacillota bacterium]|nr:permease-like cell division protein FtsX [Bacillota bacterium]